MKLFCGGNPATLGVSDSRGDWNYERFKAHVAECAECSFFLASIWGAMAGEKKSGRKAASSRENGRKGGRPKKANSGEGNGGKR